MSVNAFELTPIIDRLVSSKSKTEIRVIASWEDNLWVGTSDGFVVVYLIESGVSPLGKQTYRCGLQKKQHLGSSKPVSQIQVVPAQGKLVVLHDGKLLLLHMHTLNLLEDQRVIKGVFRFCRNEAVDLASDSMELTLVRKKGLFQYELSGNTLSPHKDLKDLEGDYRDAQAMVRDRLSLFIAQQGMYSVTNVHTGDTLELFPFDPAHTKPLICRIGPSEVVVTVWTGGLTMGMFITSKGATSRPPLQWVVAPNQVSFQFPYIVGLCSEQELVTVHSILDQQNKQVLNFRNGRDLSAGDDQVFVGTKTSIALMNAISLDSQIDDLISDNRIGEALNLAQVTFSRDNMDMDAEEFERQQQRMLSVQRKAGFAYLKQKEWSQALELLAASNADPREVITLFPDMLSARSTYVPMQHPDHGVKGIDTIVDSPNEMVAAQQALADFLRVIRSAQNPMDWNMDVDTALGQVYAATSREDLLSLIENPNFCDKQHLVPHLEQNGCHHALAVLYHKSMDTTRALSIWKSLVEGTLEDTHFPSVDYVIQVLCKLDSPNPDLIYRNAAWILKRDPKGVAMFTQTKPNGTPLFRVDEVLEFLKPFAAASMEFLEHVVFKTANSTERYHTRLAMIYLDLVLRKRQEVARRARPGQEGIVQGARTKLITMLKTSSHYRIDIMLDRIKSTDLHAECAILYGKLGEHAKALDLFVHRLEDHAAAEQYCFDLTANKDRAARQSLFLTLLRVYLVTDNGVCKYEQQAIDLLNSQISDLDVIEVMKIVPSTWSVGVVDKFLRQSIRRHLHVIRTTELQKNLARAADLQRRHEWTMLTTRPVVIHEDSRCAKCGRLLNEDPIAVYPNGVVTHLRCAVDKHVCPVTGQHFLQP